MSKRPTETNKTSTQTGKPETKPKGAKPGVPGSESSKAQSGTPNVKDARSAHDKDGNSQQRGR